jgi:transcriptional regulator with XRE-family HTH domain
LRGGLVTGLQDNRYRELIGRLRAQRVANRMTQQELADRLGRRQQFVSKYESMERRLDVIELVDIARALDLALGELLEGITTSQP